mgnify:CR=1 FL=1
MTMDLKHKNILEEQFYLIPESAQRYLRSMDLDPVGLQRREKNSCLKNFQEYETHKSFISDFCTPIEYENTIKYITEALEI